MRSHLNQHQALRWLLEREATAAAAHTTPLSGERSRAVVRIAEQSRAVVLDWEQGGDTVRSKDRHELPIRVVVAEELLIGEGKHHPRSMTRRLRIGQGVRRGFGFTT